MSDRPNFVLIVGDQHHFRHLGCYGHPVVRTPNLDRLAAEGVRFANAFCQAPLCMPSRSSFLTGLYPHATRVMRNPNALPEDIPTLTEILQDNGYDCAGVGHIGGEGLDRGMRYKFDLPDEPIRSAWALEMKTIVKDAGAIRPTDVGRLDLPEDELADTKTVNLAIEYLERHRCEPFYLNVNFYNPHPPYFIHEPYYSMYDPAAVVLPENFRDSLEGKPSNMPATRIAQGVGEVTEEEARRALAVFYGKVSCVDDQVGRLVAALERLKLMDDTVIVYMADHGDYAAEHGLFCKTGEFYEPMIHVPLMLRGPEGMFPRGRRAEGLVELVDMAPTILDLAGLATPGHMHGCTRRALAAGRTEEGARLAMSEILGKGSSCTREYDHAELGMAKQGAYGSGNVSHEVTGMMVRTATHKLCFYDDGFVELYDLERDPWEMNNVAADRAHAGIRAELTALALQRQIQTWAPVNPESDLNYHTKCVHPDCLPDGLLRQRRDWEARRED